MPIPQRIISCLAIAFGCAVTLSVQGYQFGKGNHNVYLLDALHHASPELLKNDWFTTQTFQYHAVFGVITRALMRIGMLQVGFAGGYAALIVLMQIAWLRTVKVFGGGLTTYLLSLILIYLSAGGVGLGMYQFLQDGSFLPSNIANVAMLWGFVLWIDRRPRASGVCLGIAGMFHLNYAVVGLIVWIALLAWGYLRPVCAYDRAAVRDGTIAALGLCLLSIGLAMSAMSLSAAGAPLAEFVDLYVRLRHPHHYDPSSWPIALWLSFLWPLPFAWIALTPSPRITGKRETFRIVRIVMILLALTVIALLGAGIWWTSERLIQLSLYRFTIFIKLFTCIGAAIWFERFINRPRAITWVSTIAGGIMIAVGIVRGPFFGLFPVPEDDRAYLAACDWIRENTPADAIFLVPPSEQSFRLRAQRAIVVNFKAVPQLGSELPQWRDRMCDVLAMADLRVLPKGFAQTTEAIRSRYESLSADQLAETARKYGVRYILIAHRIDAFEPRRVSMTNPAYFLYDLAR